jgi:hypothetical protein
LAQTKILYRVLLRLDTFFQLEPDNYKAVFWEEGNLADLNDLIPSDSGWTLQMARDINEGDRSSAEGLSTDRSTLFC